MSADVTVIPIDEMEGLFGGLSRRARAELGVTAWGMQVFTLPPAWDGYPEHAHDGAGTEGPQEEVYVPLAGSATLEAGEERFDLRPGVMARVGPEQRRRIMPGPDGVRYLALGGAPGSFSPAPWTELGGPMPGQQPAA
jgi:hypothetical protein